MNIETIKSELLGLNGYKQSKNPNGEQLVALTTSLTGMFYNNEHPMLTLENLYSVAPDESSFVYPTFDGVKVDYAVDDIVNDGSDNLYIRIKTDPAAQPLSNTEFWSPYTSFTWWLKEKTEAGIVQAVTDWYSRKSRLMTAKNLLSMEMPFFDGGDFDDLQDKTNKVVGQCIAPRFSGSVIMRITQVSIQMDTNQTVEVKLFRRGIKAAIKTESLLYIGDGGVQWFDVDWSLEGGAYYYVGYDESVILGNAINVYKSNPPTSCNGYYGISSFAAISDFSEMWTESNTVYNSSTNYGINYKLDVGCDYTKFIVNQKDLFKTIIVKRVAISLLLELIHNSNSLVNRNMATVNKERLMYEIDGDTQATPGNNKSLREQYEEAMNAIQFDTTGIDKVCLPCRIRSVSYRSVR